MFRPVNVSPKNIDVDVSISYDALWKFTFNGDHLTYVGFIYYLADTGKYVTNTYLTAPVDFHNGDEITVSHQANDGIFFNGNDYEYNIYCFQELYNILLTKGHILGSDDASTVRVLDGINTLEPPHTLDGNIIGGQYLEINGERRFIQDISRGNASDDGNTYTIITVSEPFSYTYDAGYQFSVYSNYEKSANFGFRARKNPVVSVSVQYSNGGIVCTGTYSQENQIPIKQIQWIAEKNGNQVYKSENILSSYLTTTMHLLPSTYTISLKVETAGGVTATAQTVFTMPTASLTVSDLTATGNKANGSTSLNWTGTASQYMVFCDSEYIGTTSATQYTDLYASLSVEHTYTIVPISDAGVGTPAEVKMLFDPKAWYLVSKENSEVLSISVDYSNGAYPVISNSDTAFNLSGLCTGLNDETFAVNLSHAETQKYTDFLLENPNIIFKSPDGKVFTGDVQSVSLGNSNYVEIPNSININIDYIREVTRNDLL